MAIFFTSDTHFNHKRMLEFRSSATVEEMNERMISAWRMRVTSKDTVYHLGDFTFGHWRDVEYIRARLPGQIHLVAGNHDKSYRKKAEFRDAFVQVVDYLEIKIDSALLECGKIVLMHYPLSVWNKSHYSSIHLHGHSHGSCPPVGRRMDVGVDTRPDLAPWSLDEVLERMKHAPAVAQDHHVPK